MKLYELISDSDCFCDKVLTYVKSALGLDVFSAERLLIVQFKKLSLEWEKLFSFGIVNFILLKGDEQCLGFFWMELELESCVVFDRKEYERIGCLLEEEIEAGLFTILH